MQSLFPGLSSPGICASRGTDIGQQKLVTEAGVKDVRDTTADATTTN
jgi:hypothetical protein